MTSNNISHIPPFEQAKIASSLGPFIITNFEEQNLFYYDISSTYSIILETCHKTEEICHIHQFSPNNYRHIDFNIDSATQNRRPQHQHACIEFMYVLSGFVTNHIENQSFTYKAGQCCIMNKNIHHCEEFSNDFQAIFLMIQDTFLNDLLDDYHAIHTHTKPFQGENLIFQLIADSQNETMKFDKIYLDCFPLVHTDNIADRLSALFNTLVLETISWDFGSSFLMKAVFARFLKLLGDPALFSINRIHSHSQGQEYLFNKISHIIKSSHGRCTRSELETLLNYNGEYLNRIVKKRTGKSIIEYGQSIGLEEARHLLLNTDKNITTIIEELGFSNRSYFYRLFKNMYGETPFEYRRRLRS